MHMAKLCARRISLATNSNTHFSLRLLHRTMPGSSNAFRSNLSERLITAHYFKDIFLFVLREYNSKVICKVQQQSTSGQSPLSITFTKKSETGGTFQHHSVIFI